MEKEFELFIREKRYVQNVSPHTIDFYKVSFKAFIKHSEAQNTGELSKVGLISLVANMRESGLSAACTDAYIRGINPFLTWLFENSFTSEHLRIKRVKFEQRILKTFTDAQVKAIINYKPKDYYQLRLHTLLMILLDTGIRINECLTLERSKVDLDNLLFSVKGKGNKERIIPFSIELRKIMVKFLKQHNFELVFPNRYGGKLRYDNMRRDFNKLMDNLGITGFEGSFHAFRRCFATSFIKQNGNTFVLQRLLGHTTQAMTSKYVKLITDDLSKEQQRTSLLTKLK